MHKWDITIWAKELQILSWEPNEKNTKYGEEYQKPTWYLDHSPTSNFCQPKEANVFTTLKKQKKKKTFSEQAVMVKHVF